MGGSFVVSATMFTVWVWVVAVSPAVEGVAVTSTDAVPVVVPVLRMRKTAALGSGTIWALVMVTGDSGLLLLSTGTDSMSARMLKPRTSWPKMVWLKSRKRCGALVTKNCEPLVSL